MEGLAALMEGFSHDTARETITGRGRLQRAGTGAGLRFSVRGGCGRTSPIMEALWRSEYSLRWRCGAIFNTTYTKTVRRGGCEPLRTSLELVLEHRPQCGKGRSQRVRVDPPQPSRHSSAVHREQFVENDESRRAAELA